MKLLIDIPDNKQGQSFLRRAKGLSYVQAVKRVTVTEAEILAEVALAKKAQGLADQVRAGRLKTRPARALLNEL